MLRLAVNNKSPEICSVHLRRKATSDIEARDIFAQSVSGGVVPVDAYDHMPYIELSDDLSGSPRPTLKNSQQGRFCLTVENFQTQGDFPLLVFDIEKMVDEEDVYVEGSKQILDPLKNKLMQSAIAVVPLLHVFNAQVGVEVERVSRLISNASSADCSVVSFDAEKEKRMMDAALNATHNVMISLYSDAETRQNMEYKKGVESVSEKINKELNSDRKFYENLMQKMVQIFEPSIRTLGENVALGRVSSPHLV